MQDGQHVCPCIGRSLWINHKTRETLGQEEVTEAQKEDVGKPETGAADLKGEGDSKTVESQAGQRTDRFVVFRVYFGIGFQRC